MSGSIRAYGAHSLLEWAISKGHAACRFHALPCRTAHSGRGWSLFLLTVGASTRTSPPRHRRAQTSPEYSALEGLIPRAEHKAWIETRGTLQQSAQRDHWYQRGFGIAEELLSVEARQQKNCGRLAYWTSGLGILLPFRISCGWIESCRYEREAPEPCIDYLTEPHLASKLSHSSLLIKTCLCLDGTRAKGVSTRHRTLTTTTTTTVVILLQHRSAHWAYLNFLTLTIWTKEFGPGSHFVCASKRAYNEPHYDRACRET